MRKQRRVLKAVVAAATGGLLGLSAVPPAGASSPTTTVTPSSASSGTAVTVSGRDFPRRTTGVVTLYGNAVAAIRTGPKGTFSTSFTVPHDAPPGPAAVTSSAGGASATSSLTVTSSSTSTTVPASQSTGFIGRSGRSLTLNGAPWRFTGYNVYPLTTDYAVNYGCGENYTAADVDALFASLRPHSVVRLWAFQQLAWNKNTTSRDFTTIDRVVSAAERSNQKVILVLADQWAGCGEVFKTESWYAGGYTGVVHDGTSIGAMTNSLSFWDWMRLVVARYANSPAVAMWEPVNEPAASAYKGSPCSSTAAASLRSFFDAVGAEIHRLAPKHLVSSGLQGSGQCGAQNGEYETLHQSPGIDVGSVHDWWVDLAPMPGDQWNGMQVRIDQMARVGKPLFVGEVGMNASDTVAGYMSLAERRDKFQAKMDAQFPSGIVGFLPWYRSKVVSEKWFNIADGDPTLALMHDYAL
ncbi:MAG: cellulase family glycosylhydrolase [Actinomycetota bacterium]|nr:cellulase family glycosylhydrolase [Actinomycetota bacterium]